MEESRYFNHYYGSLDWRILLEKGVLIMNDSGLSNSKIKSFFSKLEWYQKFLLSIPLFFLVMFITLFLLINIDLSGDIRYQQTYFGRISIFFYNANRNFEPDLSRREFNDVKTAVTTFFDVNIMPQNYQEIVRFEGDGYKFIFLPIYTVLTAIRPRNPVIISLLFTERENEMVSPLDLWTQGIEFLALDTSGTWHPEDRIARDIVIAHVQESVTSRANGGIPIFYGAGVGYPPTYISILGLQPDNIIPFEFRGNQYFFWYYLSTPHFGEILAENIDISQSFMLAEVIELFDIRVVD